MIWMAFVAGFVVGGAFAYLFTIHIKKLNAVDERLRAEKAESYHQGKLAAKEEISVERNEYIRRHGIFRKQKSMVISERIIFEGIPITPFYDHERPFDEHIDASELGMAADAVRVMAGLPDLSKMGFRITQTITEPKLIKPPI